MPVSKAQVAERLRRIKGPDLSGNIVDLGLVSEIAIQGGRVTFSITVPPDRAADLEPLRKAAEQVVSGLEGVTGVTVVLTAESPQRSAAAAAAPQPAPRSAAPRRAPEIPGVRHLIAVASGKGGVGKSTVTVNLALGLAALGHRTGILDADIFGPSQPRLLGLHGRAERGRNQFVPMHAYGLTVMSMGFLVDEETPVVWRGPLVTQALTTLLREVAWGDLDVLVIDMPPGTGDIQLSLAQQAPLSGAVIVSTPQDLALLDARKALAMFRRVDVPILGIVENMSTFICPKCGERTDIFGHGGAEAEARKLGVPFLGGIPLDMDIRMRSDSGRPLTATEPDSEHARLFREIARGVWSAAEAMQAAGAAPPEIAIGADGGSLKVSGPRGIYELPAEFLRVYSPSAEVQGHAPEQRVTVAGKRKVRLVDLRPIGNYAVRLVFDDGHDTGLFTWEYLDELARGRERLWASYLDDLAKKGLSRG